MIRINLFPFSFFINLNLLPMNKVTSVSILTMTFFKKSIAWFCFVWIIHIHIYSQLMSSMSKLTFLTVRTKALFCKVLTKTAFNFWLSGFWIEIVILREEKVFRYVEIRRVISLGRCLWLIIGLIEEMLVDAWLSDYHFYIK